jgi:PAS domain-containing protein
MHDTLDSTPYWTRELTRLRARALKLTSRRPAPESPWGDIVEQALTACGSLLRDLAGAQLECERLRGEVRAEKTAWEHLFDAMPGACVLTDAKGVILSANRAAGLFLNMSNRRLKERQLLLFTEDRDAFSGLLELLIAGSEQARATLTIRPRERRPIETDLFVVPAFPYQPPAWLWFLLSHAEAQSSNRHQVFAIDSDDRGSTLSAASRS